MKDISKLLLLSGFLSMALSSCSYRTDSKAVEMVRSEMSRNKEASYIDGLEGKLKWNYTTGLELKAFLDVFRTYGDSSVFNYAEKWYDAIIDSAGNIKTYKVSNYNTDHICPGRTLFYLYETTSKEKYRNAIEILRGQLRDQPRTSQGGFWHKKIYPYQMWLDGLYMAQPFYAEYTSKYEQPSKKDSVYRDIINNFLVVAAHTYDSQTGLYRHAWDESLDMFWCDKTTGMSKHAWGRALGWYCMGIVDALDWIPEETQGREDLISILRGIYNTLPKYSDSKTGMWYQVLDTPDGEGNYLEATCSAMFSYVALKGVRMGYLDAELLPWAKSTYQNFVKEFITVDGQGLLSINNCCEVAGLGGKGNRSGSYEYYINEKIRSNDPKGVGPFIWASLEYEMLK